MSSSIEVNRSDIVDAAVRKLAEAEHYFGASLVYMPSIYPSGTSVVLQVSGGGRGFKVSDRGGAVSEAEGLNSIRALRQEAERVTKEAAVQFDGAEFFVTDVSDASLSAAMQAVAHYSQLAANLVAMKAADRAREDVAHVLYDRLVGIFTPKRVSRDVSVMGASQHQWKFDAVVSTGDRRLVFDAVGTHQTSVVWAATKFGDLSRLDEAVRRVAVVENSRALGDMMGVISPNVSAIVELRAADEVYRRLEAA